MVAYSLPHTISSFLQQIHRGVQLHIQNMNISCVVTEQAHFIIYSVPHTFRPYETFNGNTWNHLMNHIILSAFHAAILQMFRWPSYHERAWCKCSCMIHFHTVACMKDYWLWVNINNGNMSESHLNCEDRKQHIRLAEIHQASIEASHPRGSLGATKGDLGKQVWVAAHQWWVTILSAAYRWGGHLFYFILSFWCALFYIVPFLGGVCAQTSSK